METKEKHKRDFIAVPGGSRGLYDENLNMNNGQQKPSRKAATSPTASRLSTIFQSYINETDKKLGVVESRKAQMEKKQDSGGTHGSKPSVQMSPGDLIHPECPPGHIHTCLFRLSKDCVGTRMDNEARSSYAGRVCSLLRAVRRCIGILLPGILKTVIPVAISVGLALVVDEHYGTEMAVAVVVGCLSVLSLFYNVRMPDNSAAEKEVYKKVFHPFLDLYKSSPCPHALLPCTNCQKSFTDQGIFEFHNHVGQALNKTVVCKHPYGGYDYLIAYFVWKIDQVIRSEGVHQGMLDDTVRDQLVSSAAQNQVEIIEELRARQEEDLNALEEKQSSETIVAQTVTVSGKKSDDEVTSEVWGSPGTEPGGTSFEAAKDKIHAVTEKNEAALKAKKDMPTAEETENHEDKQSISLAKKVQKHGFSYTNPNNNNQGKKASTGVKKGDTDSSDNVDPITGLEFKSDSVENKSVPQRRLSSREYKIDESESPDIERIRQKYSRSTKEKSPARTTTEVKCEEESGEPKTDVEGESEEKSVVSRSRNVYSARREQSDSVVKERDTSPRQSSPLRYMNKYKNVNVRKFMTHLNDGSQEERRSSTSDVSKSDNIRIRKPRNVNNHGNILSAQDEDNIVLDEEANVERLRFNNRSDSSEDDGYYAQDNDDVFITYAPTWIDEDGDIEITYADRLEEDNLSDCSSFSGDLSNGFVTSPSKSFEAVESCGDNSFLNVSTGQPVTEAAMMAFGDIRKEPCPKDPAIVNAQDLQLPIPSQKLYVSQTTKNSPTVSEAHVRSHTIYNNPQDVSIPPMHSIGDGQITLPLPNSPAWSMKVQKEDYKKMYGSSTAPFVIKQCNNGDGSPHNITQ